MNKIAIVLIVFAGLLNVGHEAVAAADSAILSKSVVKVVVKTAGKTNYGTGFVWKNNSHVVTSLHVMRQDGKVHIDYRNEKIPAKVVKVLRHADLVLLETETPISGVTPLSDYDPAKPAEDSKLKALGYNEDAEKFSSRMMIKGYVDPPETLDSLVPSKAKESIRLSGMPALDLNIYYANMGSLLHGYSGAPVFHADTGKFIGIGDGGLENGASDVSWIIPAAYLDKLLADGEKSLPGNLAAASEHFSAEIDAPEYKETTATVTSLLADEQITERVTFVLNKTRRFSELFDPQEQVEMIATLQRFLPFVIDYHSFSFDIYEEQNIGAVIALPSGISLLANETAQELNSSHAKESPFQINYWLETINKDPESDPAVWFYEGLTELHDKYLAFINRGDPDGTGDRWEMTEGSIANLGDGKFSLLALYHETASGYYNFVSMAANERTNLVLFTEAYLWVSDYKDIFANNKGLDCRTARSEQAEEDFEEEVKEELCDTLREMARIAVATQLTTFSNTLKASTKDLSK